KCSSSKKLKFILDNYCRFNCDVCPRYLFFSFIVKLYYKKVIASKNSLKIHILMVNLPSTTLF
ncbi:MAG: hypothetical protein WCF14_00725, partial [Nitrososphaeraceae archaeon]